MASKRKNVPASRVREWFAGLSDEQRAALPEGTKAPGSRGRLDPTTITAFAKANPREQYVQGTTAPQTVTLRVTGKDRRGRNTARNVEVPVSEARTLAGQPTSQRGRLSEAAIQQASEALSAQRAEAKAQG